MRITSFGAAGEVTGSKHLVEVNGLTLLLDCGLFQGHRTEADRKNRELGFDASKINHVLLSHAHIDHSGLLPMLAKKGYQGTIYSTHATRDLCSVMLLDSAHIQQRDAEWLSEKEMEFVAPLYTPEDVQDVMRRFISVSYDVRVPLGNDVFATFHDAGHVLGSAMIVLDFLEGDTPRKFVFSGDIGRCNMPILADPWQPLSGDAVMMESTYGNREHDPIEQADHKLATIINATIQRGGKVVIPTFALERAQEILFALKRLEGSGAIQPIPVYVDSPLVVNITEVFRLHTECFDAEFARVMREEGDPFQLRFVKYIRDRSQSMQLNALDGPAIIMAASGMCEYGRIVHHLRNTIEDVRNTILIVGFQAENTLGRRIVEKNRTVRILGVPRELNAQVKIMNEFSAHAGKSELENFAGRLPEETKILLVHGEDIAMNELKKNMLASGRRDVRIMKHGAPVEI